MEYIRVKVFPDAKKDYVEVDDRNNRIRIFTRHPAERNEANKQVTKLLAEYLDIKETDLNLILGHRGQNKTFQIRK